MGQNVLYWDVENNWVREARFKDRRTFRGVSLARKIFPYSEK
jgi:hypothetical protein